MIYSGYFVEILSALFYILVVIAVLVIITKNPVISVLYLIGLFLSIACYLISIGATFIGISYLLIYVGAVSILFLFILMLINIRVSELMTETKNSIPFMLIIALVLESAYNIVSPYRNSLYDIFSYHKLNIVGFSNWENCLIQFTHVTSIGNIMYTNFSIWLILASIILLLAMTGAILVTIKQKKVSYELKVVDSTTVAK